ncbi:MAG: hypothetical protein ACSHYA_11685 [Opitutaceae bacterium]
MPDPTNFVDQCVTYNVHQGEAAGPPGHVGVLPGKTTPANLIVRTDPRALPGAAGTPWNFTFLKYVAGEVTVAPFNGPILTGPFSGCFTFRYTNGGQQMIAHVGTSHNSSDPGTIRAKQIWDSTVNGGASQINGESPTTTITPNELHGIAVANQNKIPALCAYFEGGNAWAIAFVQAVAGVTPIPGVLRIAKVTRLPLLNWDLVKAMRQFR